MTLPDKTNTFLYVVETHKGIIYKVANSYCKNTEDRKDIVQEIVLQLWKSFDRYNKQFKYSTWIYRISLNVAISFYRKENNRKVMWGTCSEEIFNVPDFKENTEKEQHVIFLQQCIAELKELDKALMLLYLEEKSHKEIAEIMGLSETNIATKIGRIKTLLKQKFSSLQTEINL